MFTKRWKCNFSIAKLIENRQKMALLMGGCGGYCKFNVNSAPKNGVLQ